MAAWAFRFSLHRLPVEASLWLTAILAVAENRLALGATPDRDPLIHLGAAVEEHIAAEVGSGGTQKVTALRAVAGLVDVLGGAEAPWRPAEQRAWAEVVGLMVEAAVRASCSPNTPMRADTREAVAATARQGAEDHF